MSTISRPGDLQYLADRLDPVALRFWLTKSIRSSDGGRRCSLSKKRAGQFQYLVGPAQFLDLAFQGFDAIALLAGNAITHASVHLLFANPSMQGLGNAPDLDLGAINSMANHRDGYSPRCSCTMCTTRSRTSGENYVDYLVAPSFRRLELPQNPGRFTFLKRAQSAGLVVNSCTLQPRWNYP